MKQRSLALCAARPFIRHLSPAALGIVDLTGIELVSLDVFDTCLGRALADPTDVFELVGRRGATDLATVGIAPADPGGWFRTSRVDAERAARRAASGAEPALRDAYEHIRAVSDRDVRDRLLQIELEVEREVSVGRQDVRIFAELALERGLILAYLSDMYLPSLVIMDLLQRAGFPNAPVHVSNETGVSKSTGAAFERLCEQYEVVPSRVLHVGDNLRVDGFSAARRRLRVVVIDRALLDLKRGLETHPIPENLPFGDGVVLTLGANRAPGGPGARETATRIGASVIAPAQLGFASWLDATLQPDEVPLFCSRDMRDVHQVHERLRRSTERTPASHYLEISRRSVGLPALAGGITEADREFLVGGRGSISEAELWERIGLGHVDGGTRYSGRPLATAERGPVWERMLEHEELIVERALAELEQFKRYWQSRGLPTSGRAVLVDVGWRATVQVALVRCLSHAGFDVQLRGLYLATLAPVEPGIDATGWLATGGQPGKRRVALEAGIPIVELAFQADEGSVDHYHGGDAVRGPRSTARIAQDVVQAAARDTIDHWFRLEISDRPTALSALPLLRLLNSPRPEEAIALGAMAHTDRLGTTASLRTLLPEHVSTLALVPSRKAARLIRSSEWRPGLFAAAGAPLVLRRIATSLLASLKHLGRTLASQ